MHNYVVYHLHSDYSMLDSCSQFREYVELAKAQGHTAIASTEHGKTLGWVSKKLMCDEAGIKFIHGVEIYLTESLEPKTRDNYHTILLAKNPDGVRELNRLIELSSRPDHFYYTNRLTFDEFLAISDNIIKISACLASPLNKLEDGHPRYLELARHYDYLEVQPHDCDEQRDFNQRLLALSKSLGKLLIAGTDTHSATPYKAECRALRLKRKNQSYGNEDKLDLTWKTYDELCEAFRKQGALPEEEYLKAIANTNRMADSVEPFELDKSIKYPILYGSRERDSEVFTERVKSMFRQKLDSGEIPASQEQAFREAIDEEMRVFRKLRMDGFMLSMSELICWCREHGYAVGPARGSVGGSRVAYVTGIIDLNPETWHTVFSRFCNEDREEIGDIDVDVIESDRPAIFKHIVERFGESHTARVASFVTVAELGFIDEAGGGLRNIWDEQHPNNPDAAKNPWSLKKIDRIKKEFSADAEATKKKYPELFYYFDGMVGTRVSQGIHPAGMVIAPIDLNEEYGVFDKDGERCLVIDMEEVHDSGCAKYDLLVLKTVQVIRDTCKAAGIPYPKTGQINFDDPEVWADMLKCPVGIFQMEGRFAFDSLKKFQPKNLFDLSLVTAAIRPSGASYRDALLSHQVNHNPSPLIDELLKNNNGFLVYQEDIIAFLQDVCGLSGSEADTVRRGIARKKPEVLEKAMPRIMEGYCSRSDKPRAQAEEEAKEFLRIIEDASSYMFGYNHSIAYCILSYMCAYLRRHHTIEFITAFLNNAANDDDISGGTLLARLYGIRITSPKWRLSRSEYYFTREENVIAKGLASVKYIGRSVAETMYRLSQGNRYEYFTDLLSDAFRARLDTRQLQILISIDYFSEFGNQRELFQIAEMFELFKRGSAKQVRRERVDGTAYEAAVRAHSVWTTKSGEESKSYTLSDPQAIIHECETVILALGLPDVDAASKARVFTEIMGYAGYSSGLEEDRRKLYVREVFPVCRKRDGKQFGYNILTQSIGSGIEGRFTIYNRTYEKDPVKKGDFIFCDRYVQDGRYFELAAYHHL